MVASSVELRCALPFDQSESRSLIIALTWLNCSSAWVHPTAVDGSAGQTKGKVGTRQVRGTTGNGRGDAMFLGADEMRKAVAEPERTAAD
jgi:hypothetical protein